MKAKLKKTNEMTKYLMFLCSSQLFVYLCWQKKDQCALNKLGSLTSLSKAPKKEGRPGSLHNPEWPCHSLLSNSANGYLFRAEVAAQKTGYLPTWKRQCQRYLVGFAGKTKLAYYANVLASKASLLKWKAVGRT